MTDREAKTPCFNDDASRISSPVTRRRSPFSPTFRTIAAVVAQRRSAFRDLLTDDARAVLINVAQNALFVFRPYDWMSTATYQLRDMRCFLE